jgi:hypothetical protein
MERSKISFMALINEDLTTYITLGGYRILFAAMTELISAPTKAAAEGQLIRHLKFYAVCQKSCETHPVLT